MASGKGSRKKKRPPAKRPAAAPAAKAAGPATPPRPAKAAPAKEGGAPPRKPTQAERFEAARRARKRKATLVRAGVVGTVLVVVGLVAALVAADRRSANAERERLTAGSCEYDTEHDPLTANVHTPPARYEVDPPAGGDHDPGAAPARIFQEGDTLPPDAQLVHSLEHGLVVLWYRPGLTEDELAGVRAVFDDNPDDVVVVPRASLDVKVAATSWERRLRCTEVEQATLSEFVDLYVDKSPEPGRR